MPAAVLAAEVQHSCCEREACVQQQLASPQCSWQHLCPAAALSRTARPPGIQNTFDSLKPKILREIQFLFIPTTEAKG